MNIRLAAALCVLAVPTLAGAQQKPFTVDIMMKTEELGEVLFGPTGQALLFEKTSAYESSANFALDRVWSRDRATLMDASVGSASVKTVSPGDKERVWLGSYSPSGAQAGIGWFDGTVAKAGVYDLKSGELRKFDFRTSQGFFGFDSPLWLSEEEFIHYTLSADEQQKQMSSVAYTDEMTKRWANQTWRGKEPSAKVLGSGKYQSKAIDEGGTLLRVNARTGETRTLAEGLFTQAELSPDRRRLAVLRETGSLDVSKIPAQGVIAADKVFELSVYDFGKGGAQSWPCKDCNVTRQSLKWSPGGQKLFFATRTITGGKMVHDHYIYDFAKNKLEKFAPKGVPFVTSANLRRAVFTAPFLWLTDDTPAVRITRKERTSKEKAEYEWFALPAGRTPVSLTAGLKPVKDEAPLESYAAVHKGKMLLMADGEMWQIGADGKRRNLTESIAEPLSSWCSVISYWREAGARPVCDGFRVDTVVRPIDKDALAQGWVTFRVIKDDVPTGEMLFLNIDNGQTVRVARPDADSELVTASALAKSVVYRRKGDDGDRLFLSSAGELRELTYFNQQLAGVVGGKAIMLTRREAGENEDRYDWLLLPPGHKKGDRHPLLVYFYPDTKYSKEWRSDDLRAVSFLNQHIPAAHGYAVLLATMKISTREELGNPMREMHGQLVHAAENVVSQGYADPERWAIMGHSYGGYGTNSVITQTNRFKAAVSMDGPSNLTSGYAIGLARDKATSVAAGLSFGALWSEGGQGRMGVAPWQNPQRYIDNSPLFFADKIQTPLMLIHGDYDFVNINEAEQLFNALHRQGKDAQFVRYWGEEHTLSSPANIRDMWNRIFTWLDTNLDIGRDGQGRVAFENGRVKSRD